MNLKPLSVITLLSISLVAFNANAALVTNSTLNFDAYTGSGSIPQNGNGSWFSVDAAINGVTGITSLDGLVIGTTQTATGSHLGAPDGTELSTIDTPHTYFNNTGMISTISDTNILSTTTNTAVIDFTGIRWSWGSTDNIVIFDPAAGNSGTAQITCSLDCRNGDNYILDYIGNIQIGDPSGLGGEEVRIHLEGTISAVPVPAAGWLFISGLLGLLSLNRRKLMLRKH